MIRTTNLPAAHAASVAQSVIEMFSGKTSTARLHRPIPVLEPNPGLTGTPVAADTTHKVIISPDDWDDLFNAIQTRLETCVDEASNNSLILPLPRQRAVTKAAVLECVASMKQLHASLILERHLQQRR